VDPRRRAVALLVAGTFFMENLDGTIIATAAPAMARSFGVASSDIGIAITSYLLTMAVLIPLSGWIAHRFGVRRVFLTAIAVFTVASALCAAAPTLPLLIAARVLQGVGAAMMVPVGRLSVLADIPKSDVIRAIAYLTWPALVAPVIAPALGGFFATYLSWEWIFLVNVPLGMIAFVAALRLIPSGDGVRPARLDWVGLALTCTAVAALVTTADLLASETGRWTLTTVLAVAGAALLTLAVRHLLRTPHPLLNLAILRIRTFRVPHSSGGLYRLTISAVPFLLPLMFQDAFGWSAVQAGSMVLFVFLGNVAIKPTTTWMLRTFGFRRVLVAATSGAALSMVLAALLTAEVPLWLVAVVLTFGGVARSVGFTAYATITFADIDQPQLSQANTLSATIQQIAAGFGVAVGAVALRLGDTVTGTGNDLASVAPYRFAFFVLAALTVVAVIDAVRLDPAAGSSLRPVR
jgi:EmrB/QacA subfamily drug resistance transporter